MASQSYLIDTNVIFALEDHRQVEPAFADFVAIAAKHKVDVLVHAAARDDIKRDKDEKRRQISLSKLAKFQTLPNVRGLQRVELERDFGRLARENDVVDATLLHAVTSNAVDFLVTEDKRLHDRAKRHSIGLARRVLFLADAVALLRTTYEPVPSHVRYVEEVTASEILLTDNLFDSLRADYPQFDDWWRTKCLRERRPCWVVYDPDQALAGLVVRKDETANETSAVTKAKKILKICTLKVRPERRGISLGELLLKKIFWFAQRNNYDLVYLTVFDKQIVLIGLLEYYGFVRAGAMSNGEFVYEKSFSRLKLERCRYKSDFELARQHYPRFVSDGQVRAFGIPIREAYHDTLFPDLKNDPQPDLFEIAGMHGGPNRPGNTIRKVYLCRSPSKLGPAGSILLFYKGKSLLEPSQAMTAIGVFEDLSTASSTKELMRLAGGRSVYSEQDLTDMNATAERPIKVINYLLASYIEPAIRLPKLLEIGVFKSQPPQSIVEINADQRRALFALIDTGFQT